MTLAEIKKAEPKFWQRLLRFGGYYTGAIDGILGPQSRAAEARWLADAESAQRQIGTFDERSEANLATLLPSTQLAARKWLNAAKEKAASLGVDVRIICGTRTYGEQRALFAKRPRVTKANAGQSWHNFGLAWDMGIFQGKSYLGDSPHYITLGRLARNLPSLSWGGDWTSFKDEPHIQLQLYPSTSTARAAFER